jgi:hypothetical protein
VSASSLAPIALFVYNRPEHMSRVVEALAGNEEAPISRLFVYSDGPKNAAAMEMVAEVRSRARAIKGFLSVEFVEQATNQGVARSIIRGVSDLSDRFGKVIVLEDDLMPSRHFLRYMNRALDLYQDVEEVISIHGYSYPVNVPLPETFFLRGADCWGWATWRRGWKLFEPDGSKLLAELQRRKLTREFDFGGSYPYTRMLRDCLTGKNDSWAIRWYASAFLFGKLTLYPGSSQVQNIGADGSGVHVGSTRSFEHLDWGRPVMVGDIAIEESLEARQKFSNYLAGLRSPLIERAWRKLKKLMNRRPDTC